MRRGAGWAVAALSVFVAVVMPPGVAGADSQSWQVVPSPNPTGSLWTQLDSVTCVSLSDCTAVGYWQNAGGYETLVESWGGTSWQIVPSPDPAGTSGAALSSVSCTGPSDCTAVGYWTNDTTTPYNTVETLVETWDGTSWQIVPSPNPTGSTLSQLLSVSCLSPSQCIAVGSGQEVSGAQQLAQTLVETWDGTSWQIVPSPSPSLTQSGLNSLSCLSGSSCMAVGYWYNPSTVELPLAEKWDGTSWSVLTTPLPSGATQGAFNSVSCISLTFCLAGGWQANGTSLNVTLSLGETWDGTSWQSVSLPDPSGSTWAGVSSMSCTGPSACTAVGDWDSGSWAGTWDGTSGQIVDLPQTSGFTPVDSVTCLSSSECTLVGSYSPSGGPHQSLIESTANAQPPPQLAETPIALAVPLLALGLFGAVLVISRRNRDVDSI